MSKAPAKSISEILAERRAEREPAKRILRPHDGRLRVPRILKCLRMLGEGLPAFAVALEMEVDECEVERYAELYAHEIYWLGNLQLDVTKQAYLDVIALDMRRDGLRKFPKAPVLPGQRGEEEEDC